MQPVEHRRSRQGKPDASRSLHPPLAGRPRALCGGAGRASAVIVPRGPCVRHGCADTVERPRAARHHAPGSNNSACSSADPGRSGCTAAPGPSTARTGTTWRMRPCVPRAQAQGAGRTRPSAPHCVQHRLHRHGVGRGAVDSRQAMDRRRARLTSASSCVVQRAARALAHDSPPHRARIGNPLRERPPPQTTGPSMHTCAVGAPPAAWQGPRFRNQSKPKSPEPRTRPEAPAEHKTASSPPNRSGS